MLLLALLALTPVQSAAAAAATDAALEAYAAPHGNPPTPCPSGWRGCDGPTSIRIFPGDAPDEHAGFPTAPENINCLTAGATVKACKDVVQTNVKVPTITPFLVDSADSAMIIAPGGGYSGLAMGREGTDIAAWLNSIGVSAFVLKYRVPARPW